MASLTRWEKFLLALNSLRKSLIVDDYFCMGTTYFFLDFQNLYIYHPWCIDILMNVFLDDSRCVLVIWLFKYTFTLDDAESLLPPPAPRTAPISAPRRGRVIRNRGNLSRGRGDRGKSFTICWSDDGSVQSFGSGSSRSSRRQRNRSRLWASWKLEDESCGSGRDNTDSTSHDEAGKGKHITKKIVNENDFDFIEGDAQMKIDVNENKDFGNANVSSVNDGNDETKSTVSCSGSVKRCFDAAFSSRYRGPSTRFNGSRWKRYFDTKKES